MSTRRHNFGSNGFRAKDFGPKSKTDISKFSQLESRINTNVSFSNSKTKLLGILVGTIAYLLILWMAILSK